jgi:APAF-1 helical domain
VRLFLVYLSLNQGGARKLLARKSSSRKSSSRKLATNALPDGLLDLHRDLISTYERECEGDWALGSNDGYFFQYLLHHMIRARGVDAAFEIFSDLDWLLSKWRAAGARSLLADCDYFSERQIASAISAVVTDASNNVDISGLCSVLNTPRSRSRHAFSITNPKKYVLVAGTGTLHLDNAIVYASEAIGLELARAGFGLISGGWQGVDHIACREYVNQLRRDQLSSKGRLVHVIPQGSTPDLWELSGFAQEGDLDFAESSSSASRRSVGRANVVVMVGGAGGTFAIYQDARQLGKPVYPIPRTGGDAAHAFNELIKIRPEFQSLDLNILSKRDGREVARRITEFELAVPNRRSDDEVNEYDEEQEEQKDGLRAPESESGKEDFEEEDLSTSDTADFEPEPLSASPPAPTKPKRKIPSRGQTKRKSPKRSKASVTSARIFQGLQ